MKKYNKNKKLSINIYESYKIYYIAIKNYLVILK